MSAYGRARARPLSATSKTSRRELLVPLRCSREHLQRIGIGPASRALCGTSLRSNVKHCRVTQAGLRSLVFRPAGRPPSLPGWTIHDADGQRRGNRERGREGKLGLGISRVELALISRTGRNRGPLDHPFGVMMAAGLRPSIRVGVEPDWRWNRFQDWCGFGAARRARLCCSRSRSMGPWLRRLRGGRGERSPRSPGRRRRCESCATSCCCRAWGRPSFRCGLRWLRVCAERVIAVPDGREPLAVVV